MKKLIAGLCCIVGLSVLVKADTWSLPTQEKYCSENKKFCLKVKPKNLNSQLAYFQDKADGKENPGADKNIKGSYCEGAFFSKSKRIWKMRLDNEVAPVSALISNDGNYVITFDNWHRIGYGDNVVAIYDGLSGRLIKKLGLSDFLTESDIYNLPASTSSINWHGTHQIDYGKKQLILKVVKPSKTSEFFDVRIDLTSGAVLDEIVDRIPSLQILFLVKEAESNFNNSGANIKDICASKEIVAEISSAELFKRIIRKDMPEYPPAARAVRASGDSVFDVTVASDGSVECVAPVSGHPLLRATLANSVRRWTFEKNSTKYRGKLVIEGKPVLILNGKVAEKENFLIDFVGSGKRQDF